jgi:hypothetical protein
MRRLLTAAGTAALAAALLASSPAAAQTYTPPRTPDGQPDLQGVWTNETITPLERPPNLAGKPFYTPEEVAALEKQAAERRANSDRKPSGTDVGTYNQFWFDSGTKVVSSRQTSLVIDPPDGRVPVKPDAEKVRDANEARVGDGYEFMSPWDRCIARGVPGSFFPAGYNNAYQIIQTPGYVVIHSEMIHDARIIPIDGRPHLPSRVKTWTGDSRGRWEGDTLIVETTNYNNKGWIATNAAAGRIKGIPQSEALRVVERFTRKSPTTISYEVTIDDPTIYTRPWKAAIPLERDDSYRIYEYACHEGNRAVENILKGARASDR